MRLQPFSETLTADTPDETVEHLLLDIHRNHPVADEVAQGTAEEPFARADVYGGAAGSYIGGQDAAGILKEPSNEIIERKTAPRWADTLVAREEDIEDFLHRLSPRLTRACEPRVAKWLVTRPSYDFLAGDLDAFC